MIRRMILELIAQYLRLRKIWRRNHQEYLDRYSVRKQWPELPSSGSHRVYLHHMLSEDDDGHHSHPWSWGFSVVLRGGYTEEYFDAADPKAPTWEGGDFYLAPPVKTREVRWFNFIRASKYHRIVKLHGDTWTLFFCGKLTGKSWGFYMPGRGHVEWRTRLKERGETA